MRWVMDDIISVKTVKAAIIITAAVIADKIQSVYIPAPQKLTARCEKINERRLSHTKRFATNKNMEPGSCAESGFGVLLTWIARPHLPRS